MSKTYTEKQIAARDTKTASIGNLPRPLRVTVTMKRAIDKTGTPSPNRKAIAQANRGINFISSLNRFMNTSLSHGDFGAKEPPHQQ
jgi:hypothetical protein